MMTSTNWVLYLTTTFTFALLAAGHLCPSDHPHAYFRGDHCCSTAMAKMCKNVGDGCDLSTFGTRSRCCQQSTACADKPCKGNECGCYPKGAAMCYADTNACKCKPGYEGNKCKKCWPVVENSGTEQAPDCGCQFKNHYIDRADLGSKQVPSLEACHQVCVNHPDCSHFSYKKDTKTCYPKSLKALKYRRAGMYANIKGKVCSASRMLDCFTKDEDIRGSDLGIIRNVASAELCEKACKHKSACDGWVWRKSSHHCYTKSLLKRLRPDNNYDSGLKNCAKIGQNTATVTDCGCHGKTNMNCKLVDNVCEYSCKQGYKGAKCNMCWSRVENLGTPQNPRCGCTMNNGLINGADLGNKVVASLKACHQDCVNNADCSHFTYKKDTKTCYAKGFKALEKRKVGLIAGTRVCADAAADMSTCRMADIDYLGWDIGFHTSDSAGMCQKSCQHNSKCDAWVWNPTGKRCHLKSMMKGFRPNNQFTSGLKNCFQFQN